jgi:quinol monooxygenase YgiN
MYNICVKFRCIPGKREAFVDKVKSTGVLDAIRKEEGCLKYDYYFSQKDENELLLIEAWETKRHQEIHVSQPHMDVLRGFKENYITNTELREFELK